jgi:predicted metal-dependent hydrolase
MISKKLLIPNFIILNQFGDDIKVIVNISSRATRIIIKISQGIAYLVLPNNDYIAGHNFLLKKELWIRKKLHQIDAKKAIDPNIIPIFGKNFNLHYINLNNQTVQIKNNNIYVYGTEENQTSILIEFLQKILINKIKKILIPLAQKHKIEFDYIRIMNNKTRWGSCSSKAILSFNWRLVFAEESVLLYLIAHEMSHIIEMNHSKKFWDLVEKIYPEYHVPKSWLKKNGLILHQYFSSYK